MRYLLNFLFVASFFHAVGQVDSIPAQKSRDTINKDSIFFKKGLNKSKPKDEKKITIKDYKIINSVGDTTFLDTTLTIGKDYRYNVLRRDDFELMPFSNVGQSFNELGIDLDQDLVLPGMGARAKHFGYLESEDITYYHVPTPMTELMFKTTFEQGQFLDALLTFNTSPRFNASMAYTGFRSLGKYIYEQAEWGRFRSTFNYKTENNRYWVRGHIAAQDLNAEENGGLLNKEEQFESGEEDFLDRSRIDLLFTNANSRVLGRRYFLDHQFNLVRPRKDSLKNRSTLLAIGHKFQYESRYFQYSQSAVPTLNGEQLYGDVFEAPIDDRANLQVMQNQLSASFSNKVLGNLTGMVDFYNYNYFFSSLLIQDGLTIANKLKGDEMLLGASYKNSIGPLRLKGHVRYGITGNFSGTLLNASADFKLNQNNRVFGAIHGSSRLPNFNFLLFQSDFQAFNWNNVSDFEKQRTQSITFGVDSKFFGNIAAKYSAMENYTYFKSIATEEQIAARLEDQFVRPFQEESSINYLKIRWNKEFKWRKWSLNSTVQYQNVTQDTQVLNVPELLTRNSFFFSSDVFKKAMYLQTGVTFKYFTAYNMNAFHPVLGEFYVQESEELGGYPLIDFFLNMKVRQTRIYFKAEHLNTIWSTKYDYYAAPNYPYRDFVIRFGLVWNFFS